MKNLSKNKLIERTLASLRAEVDNNVNLGLSLIDNDFHKISVIKHENNLFPKVKAGDDIENKLKQTFSVKGRQFYIYSYAVNIKIQTVFVELIEVEPSKDKSYVWPYIMICKFKDGKIYQTKHYGDPTLLKENLLVEQVENQTENEAIIIYK